MTTSTSVDINAMRMPSFGIATTPYECHIAVVLAMQAERIDAHYFRLYLCTEAGTYIKEFVHGDLGRTQPSVSILL